jgi:hypothetical protein
LLDDKVNQGPTGAGRILAFKSIEAPHQMNKVARLNASFESRRCLSKKAARDPRHYFNALPISIPTVNRGLDKRLEKSNSGFCGNMFGGINEPAQNNGLVESGLHAHSWQSHSRFLLRPCGSRLSVPH